MKTSQGNQPLQEPVFVIEAQWNTIGYQVISPRSQISKHLKEFEKMDSDEH